MKLRWIILTVIALVLAIFVGIPVYSHYHLKHRVARYRAELRQRGEKTTIAEVIPPAPTNGPNGAMAFLAAAGQLRSDKIQTYEIISMRGMPPGRAEVIWQRPTLLRLDGAQRTRTNLWPLLAQAMASNQVALTEVRSALSNPVVRFTVNYAAGFRAGISHVVSVKNAAQWLSAAAVLGLHEGRLESAHENLMALLADGKSLQDEPFLISQLVRIAAMHIALNIFWEAPARRLNLSIICRIRW